MKCNLIELRKMGRGSYGVTYEVEDFVSGEKSAYKVFTENLGFILSLIEIDVFFRIRNNNLIFGKELFFPEGLGKECILSQKNKNSGENGGIVMSLQRGDASRLEPLFEKLFNVMKITNRTVQSEKLVEWMLRMTVQCSLGLECLHSSGYYHRDVKLENILYSISPDGNLNFKVADYGFCYPIRSVEQIVYGYGSGTEGYFPPEYYYDKERLDNTNDVYALGVALFTMLVGENALINAEAKNSRGEVDSPKTLRNLETLLVKTNYVSSKLKKVGEWLVANRISPTSLENYGLLCRVIEKMLRFSYVERFTFPMVLDELEDGLKENKNISVLFTEDKCYSEEVVFVLEDEEKVRRGLNLIFGYVDDKLKYTSLTIALFLRSVRFSDDAVEDLVKKCRNLALIFYETSSSRIKKISPFIIDECIELVGILEGKIFCDPIYKRITTMLGLKQLFNLIVSGELEVFYSFLNYEDIGVDSSFFEQSLFERRLREVL